MGKCVYFDINIAGIFITFVVTAISMYASYSETAHDATTSCKRSPAFITSEWNDFDKRIRNSINNAKTRVNVMFSGTYDISTIHLYYEEFKNANKSSATVSFIVSDNTTFNNLTASGFNANFDETILIDFIVIDNQALLYSPAFKNYSKFNDSMPKASYIEIQDCETGLDDIVGFYNYKWNYSPNTVNNIRTIAEMAKTSITMPLFFENTNESFYFFYNNRNGEIGQVGRLSTDLIIPRVFSAAIGDIYIYLDAIPQCTSQSSSFYTIFQTKLIDQANNYTNNYTIRFLLPDPKDDIISRKFLNATAAFSNANISLYNDTYLGSNYIILPDRAFVFSHSLKGALVENNTGFHFCSNGTEFMTQLKKHFNETWNVSEHYHFNHSYHF